MTNGNTVGTADATRERGSGNDVPVLALMRVDRLAFTAGLAFVVFLGSAVGATTLESAVAKQPRSDDLIDTLFPSTITAVVPGSTPIVSIGPLVPRESRR